MNRPHVLHGDARTELRRIGAGTVDAIVTDPPYELGFMAKGWDATGIAFDVDLWAECLRVLKPGGHLLAFGGTRTYHRMVVAIEDAGFEIRDSIHWIYGSGFPKSLDVSKAIDKGEGHWRGRAGSVVSENASMGAANYERSPKGDPITPEAATWAGWGTALKPAHEPIVVARKPLVGTVAANVLAHGTGAINVDGCRVESEPDRPTGLKKDGTRSQSVGEGWDRPWRHEDQRSELCELHAVARCTICLPAAQGRWPANIVLSHDEDCFEPTACVPTCPVAEMDRQSGTSKDGVAVNRNRPAEKSSYAASGYEIRLGPSEDKGYGGSGGASRFFPAFRYQAKAPTSERPVGPNGEKHATVKPLALMRWLVRLVTPPGGTVLDPFAGSGTTLEAAILEGFAAVGIEFEADHLPLIEHRIDRAMPDAA